MKGIRHTRLVHQDILFLIIRHTLRIVYLVSLLFESILDYIDGTSYCRDRLYHWSIVIKPYSQRAARFILLYQKNIYFSSPMKYTYTDSETSLIRPPYKLEKFVLNGGVPVLLRLIYIKYMYRAEVSAIWWSVY